MNTKKEPTGYDYFSYALYAFGGLGLEILLMMVENQVYGSSGKWSVSQHLLHWGLTCLLWGGMTLMLAKRLPSDGAPVTAKNGLIAGILAVIAILYTSWVWEGFKPYEEFVSLGAVKFIGQYVYYLFEGMLITMIIAFGQKAFEVWFKTRKNIPYGGLLLALTWGLIHILTQGATTGLFTFVLSILYGLVYLALRRNGKLSYLVITLMFLL
ncbi:hypothetical protein [Gorillibacterium timonense]|uniref:hypothetical protein n=1 Tax=Gorillibacterium timonense TaxID=1689269 RepID=UPI00071CF7A3|nr:hypothetical protein [Gorillibacterium timonense]